MSGRVSRLVRSGANLYIASIANNLTGYVYWLLISRLAGPGVLGVTSAVVGFSALIAGALSLGLGGALQKLVPECLSRGEDECARRYYGGALLLYIGVYALASMVLLAIGLAGLGLAKYTPHMLVASSLLLALGVAQAPYSCAIALLRTEAILYASLAGNAFKLLVGVGLVWLGYGWPGALAGYAALSASQLVLTLAYTLRELPPKLTLLGDVLGELLKAGLPNWVPGMVALLGQWLAVIVVYGFTSPEETGLYYAAQAIASLTLGASTVILGALLPTLSGMGEGRDKLALGVMRVALAIITPIAAFVAAYSSWILGLLGPKYSAASSILVLLVLGAVPNIISMVIANYIYSLSMYKETLLLGLAQNVPKIALYPLLISRLAGLGAALASTTGSLTGLLYALYIGGQAGLRLDARMLALTLAPPTIYAIICGVPHINLVIGIVLLLLLYATYARVGVIRRSDIREIMGSFLSEDQLYRAYKRLKPVVDMLLPPE